MGESAGLKKYTSETTLARLVFHSQEVGAEAHAGHAGRDIEHIGQVLEGIALQNGDLGKGGQTDGLEESRHGGDMGDQDKAENDDAPEEEAEAGDHRAPVLRTLSFAHHPVDGEQHSGAQGQSYAHHVQLDMQGVDNGQGPQDLQTQGCQMAPLDGLLQDHEGKKGNKALGAAEQDRHHRRTR